MRIVRYGTPRFFVEAVLSANTQVDLPQAQAHHAARVLRLGVGEAVVLFDGSGGEWQARIVQIGKREVRVGVVAHAALEREPPFPITLVQALAASERMDYSVQKAVELGASAIETVVAEKSVVRLAGERAAARAAHWRRIAIAACEQCGRNRIPAIAAPITFSAWMRSRRTEDLRLIASPGAGKSLRDVLTALATKPSSIVVAIGPEAGFAEREEQALTASGFVPVHLGPRILRTETVAPAMLAAINALAGDWI